MEQIKLKATKRKILGKQVKSLRREGIVPAHVFGHGIESAAVQCNTSELQRVIAEAGRTRLINLVIGRSEKPHNVMVREIQRDPITRELLHVDLYQVTMTEKLEVKVPIVLIGEAPALRDKAYRLAQELNTLEVQCFPDKIPNNIELDISSLAEVNQTIRVRDIKLGDDVTILNNPDVVVVKISERPVEEVVEKPPVAAAAPEAAVPGAEAQPEEKAETPPPSAEKK